jgi:hypothetical protein
MLVLKIQMRMVIVITYILMYYIVIEYEIKLKYDEDGILSYETIVAIFDKRSVIKGIKKMKYDFLMKRR